MTDEIHYDDGSAVLWCSAIDPYRYSSTIQMVTCIECMNVEIEYHSEYLESWVKRRDELKARINADA